MKTNNKTEKPTRMSYDAYVFIKQLIEGRENELERVYRAVIDLAPSSLNEAHKNYLIEVSKLRRYKEELHLAAQSTYKDHPNKEMREFWGLDE